MESTREELKRRIQERTEENRRKGDTDQFETKHSALCDTLDQLVEEGRGSDCAALRQLVKDEFPNHYNDFEIYYLFKMP